MPEIAELFNVPSTSIIHNDLRRFGIIVRDLKTSATLPKKIRRSIATSMKNYGTCNPLSRNASPRKRMKEKLLRERGVENVFQLPEVITKIRDSLVNRPESITSRFSSQHREIVELLKSIGLEPTIEFRIAFDGGYRSYDVKVGNRLIEIQGDYWHANPAKYEASHIVEWSMGKLTAEQIWARDAFKKDLAEINGYDLFVVWEFDWKTRREVVVTNILNFLGQSNANAKIPEDAAH